jgi:hypothetical protein
MANSLNKLYILASVLLLLVGASNVAQAEQKKVLGEWDVHYIVIPSTFLTPEVARANDIRRSDTNALVNISVLSSKTKEALEATVTGSARNLLGTTKPLTFKMVKEGDAIYHLATVDFDDKEVLRFEIDLQQGNTTQVLRFQQKMYSE